MPNKPSQPKPVTKNGVIEIYRGVPVKKYESITIRIDSLTKKRLIDLQQDTGLSERKIICYSSKPCAKCADQFVIVFDNQDKQHKIPKGLISKVIP
jgi:hypothetical protein